MAVRPESPAKDDSLQAVVAAHVRRLRELSDLSQERLAALAFLTRDTVRAVEIGQTDVRLSTVTQIARVFGIQPRDLVDPDYTPELATPS